MYCDWRLAISDLLAITWFAVAPGSRLVPITNQNSEIANDSQITNRKSEKLRADAQDLAGPTIQK
jgi:hypothetical protein